MKQTVVIDNRQCLLYQEGERPKAVLVQPLGVQERSGIDDEVAIISEATGTSFVMAAIAIEDWEVELTPWHDPAVSKNREVGEHALDTLDYITDHLVPWLTERYGNTPFVLGGYSLGGLFARWTVSKVHCFEAAAAVSPSLWIAAWQGFSDAHDVYARYVYLSLGDREERSRTPILTTIATAIQCQQKLLEQAHVVNTFEWNPGNHFQDNGQRTAKGFVWAMENLQQR